MALPRSEEIKDLALKFSKQQLSGLAQRGEIDPMTAVMAGMMRDRIVSEEMRQNMPETTVADDILGAAQQMGQPQQMGQSQDQLAQMQQPVEGQPQMAMMAEGGLASIPFDDDMFDYAGGGIVAFSNGGTPSQRILDSLTIQERAEYQRTGKLPQRLQDSETVKFARQGTGVPVSSAGLAAQGFTPPGPPPPPGPRPQPEPAAVTAAPASTLSETLLGRLDKAYGVQQDGSLPGLPTDLETIFKERAEAEQRAGVDKDFFKNEAKRIVDQRDELKADKKNAANMRLIEAGLRIMGGDSPYAFVNIGKGASEALKGFADDIKDLQKTMREYDKSERELLTAQQLYARTKSDGALKTLEERKARNQEQAISLANARNNLQLGLAKLDIQREGIEVQRAGVEAQRATASKPSQLRELINLATEGTPEERALAQGMISQKSGSKPMSQYELATIRQRSMRDADAALNKNMAYGRLSRSNKPEDQAAARKMREDLITEYMQLASGRSNLGGATFLGFEE